MNMSSTEYNPRENYETTDTDFQGTEQKPPDYINATSNSSSQKKPSTFSNDSKKGVSQVMFLIVSGGLLVVLLLGLGGLYYMVAQIPIFHNQVSNSNNNNRPSGENEPSPFACLNQGTVSVPFPGIFNCLCPPGYTGPQCELELKRCLSTPCQNRGSCNEKKDGYSCFCSPGYNGTNCEIDQRKCNPNPCKNDGTCWEDILPNDYSCYCGVAFSGKQCEIDHNKCRSNPCQNGGFCFNEKNNYSCSCSYGFSGSHCENEIMHCSSAPCQNSGSCIEEKDGYSCACNPGYSGTNCELVLDQRMCHPNPCKNNGTCRLDAWLNDIFCDCGSDFSGKLCETDHHMCRSNPCQSGAYCINGKNNYSCSCADGFSGNHCENEVTNDTKLCGNGTFCQNSQLCHMTKAGLTCKCNNGSNCKIDFFVGNVSQTWEKAREDCQSYGGDLAAWGIRNTTARRYVKRFLESRSEVAYWVGISDIRSEGTWRFVDGTISTLSNTDFQSGEPDNMIFSFYNADCGLMRRSFDFRIVDYACITWFQPLCERRTI